MKFERKQNKTEFLDFVAVGVNLSMHGNGGTVAQKSYFEKFK